MIRLFTSALSMRYEHAPEFRTDRRSSERKPDGRCGVGGRGKSPVTPEECPKKRGEMLGKL